MSTVTLDFHLDSTFWTEVAGDEIDDGDVHASVTVEPMRGVYELTFRIDGTVTVPCDRCLAPLQMPVDVEEQMTVELSDVTDDSDDRVILLNEKDPRYDMGWLMYELVALSLPMVRTHDPEDCDPEMTKYLVDSVKSEETQSLGDNPQWDKLREIHKKRSNNN